VASDRFDEDECRGIAGGIAGEGPLKLSICDVDVEFALVKWCESVNPDCIKASLLERDKILFLIEVGDNAPAAKSVALLNGSSLTDAE
jgi:hypothetical protein